MQSAVNYLDDAKISPLPIALNWWKMRAFDEVSGLVEWPVTLLGSFDEDFLRIPDAVTQLTIRTNQKCFVTRKGERLSNHFILVSNIIAKDGGARLPMVMAKLCVSPRRCALFLGNRSKRFARFRNA